MRLNCTATGCGARLVLSAISGRALTTCNHAEAQKIANRYNKTVEELRDAEKTRTAMDALQEDDSDEGEEL